MSLESLISNKYQKKAIVFIGVPGGGKTTYTHQLNVVMKNQINMINQDMCLRNILNMYMIN